MFYRPYRPEDPEDFAALYAIEEVCFQPPLRFSRAYMRRLVSSGEAATWIAEEEDGQMAGFAIVEWSGDADARTGYIQTIEVAPEKRRLGAGAELMRRVERSARSAGARVIWLHVDAENANAIRLYEAHGYQRKGREANFYPRGRAALVYAKSLEYPVEET
jgi:ribosomal protein S18 acetylase RimI-like enzyme